MPRPDFVFAVSFCVVGLLAGLAIGRLSAQPAHAEAAPVAAFDANGIEVTLHHFTVRPDKKERFKEWIAFLHGQHGPAVASLERERTYFEAMFTDPKSPADLYWVVAKGRGGAPVETSPLAIDRVHEAYMAEVLLPGSHETFQTQNVLMPDFVVDTIRRRETARTGAPKP